MPSSSSLSRRDCSSSVASGISCGSRSSRLRLYESRLVRLWSGWSRLVKLRLIESRSGRMTSARSRSNLSRSLGRGATTNGVRYDPRDSNVSIRSSSSKRLARVERRILARSLLKESNPGSGKFRSREDDVETRSCLRDWGGRQLRVESLQLSTEFVISLSEMLDHPRAAGSGSMSRIVCNPRLSIWKSDDSCIWTSDDSVQQHPSWYQRGALSMWIFIHTSKINHMGSATFLMGDVAAWGLLGKLLSPSPGKLPVARSS